MREFVIIMFCVVLFLFLLLCILPFISNPTLEKREISQKNLTEIKRLTGGMEKDTSFFAVYSYKYCWVSYVHQPRCKSTYLSTCGICFWKKKEIGWRIIDAISLTTAEEIVPYGTPRFTEIVLECFAPRKEEGDKK